MHAFVHPHNEMMRNLKDTPKSNFAHLFTSTHSSRYLFEHDHPICAGLYTVLVPLFLLALLILCGPLAHKHAGLAVAYHRTLVHWALSYPPQRAQLLRHPQCDQCQTFQAMIISFLSLPFHAACALLCAAACARTSHFRAATNITLVPWPPIG